MENNYISLTQAQQLARDDFGCISKNAIYNLCIDSIIDCIQDKQTKRWQINEQSLIDYLKNNDIKREGCGWIRWRQGDKFTLIRGYDYPYAFNTRTGEIANMRTGYILTPSPNKIDDNYYLQVQPILNGIKVPRLVHKLITSEFPNPYRRNYTHHINGNRLDNRPCNLLLVHDNEHAKLHSLMKTDKETYKREIARIRKENKQKLYKIPHLDWEHSDTLYYWMWVDATGYKAYINNGDVPFGSIKMEAAERR